MTTLTGPIPGSYRESAWARVARLWEELHSPVVGRRIAGTVPVSVVAGLASLAASASFVPSGLSLAYGDALSHLTIARRLFDTMTDPGLGQLGTVWLPIPHVLLAPFVLWLWAWQSGWGAALLGAGCLAATAAGCYRAAARWGLGLTPRLVVVALIVANPSMLYLHSTALTEPVLIAGISGTLAGVSNWATKSRRLSPGELAVFAGIPAAIATMSRYEGWALVLAGSLFVALVAWLRDRRLAAVVKYVFGFAVVPFTTMLWWLAYNWVTFHDPLAFLFGEYSANALQADLVAQGLTTKGDLVRSVATMNAAVAGTAGTGTLALAAAALLILVFTERSLNRWLFLAMTSITWAFMAFSLYAGQAVIFNPASSDTSVWNNRYGMATVLPLALVTGIGVDVVSTRLKRTSPRLANLRRSLLGALVAVAIIGQSVWQLQDPSLRSFVLSEASTQYTLKTGARSAAEWLGGHYDGGRIILDEAVADNNILPLAGIPLREYYLRSTDTLFSDAIADPTAHARWLWASDDSSDAVTNALAASPAVAGAYQVAFSDDTVTIYLRTGG
ncbi:hypothetical protein [Propionicimonas sp.]|uniref:hypothetical protein n=1 Tax=Propionicimonas sp. TaxID=1955623 RepID=UPI0039E4AFB4